MVSSTRYKKNDLFFVKTHTKKIIGEIRRNNAQSCTEFDNRASCEEIDFCVWNLNTHACGMYISDIHIYIYIYMYGIRIVL